MKNKILIALVLVLALTANAFVSSCGKEGPVAPPDTLPPTIVATSPYYDERNVPLNASVTISFNETLESTSVNGESLSLFQGTSAVPGTASCGGTSALFKPEAALAANSTYFVRVTTGVRDLSGNAMTAPYLYSFTTGTTVSSGTFWVTPSAGSNGTISPAGPQSVLSQATATFTITAAPGYHLVTPVGGTCGGSLSGSIFATNPVTADCTVSATFAAEAAVTHTISAGAGSNGSISPSGAVTVEHGSTRTFTITANSGYRLMTPVGGTCGGSLSGSTYTTNAVNADCTVSASFVANPVETHTVTASAGPNGSISPSGAVTVNHGATRSFTISPNSGYHVQTPLGGTCGGSLSGSTYTTNAVNADCTVTASFAADAVPTHTITADAGDHGSISPSGRVTVNHGATRTFTISPNKGYRTVTPVGGTCGGSLSGSTYTTNPVNSDCTVTPAFARITSMVTPAPGPHGIMVPGLPVAVYYEDRATFSVTPDASYRIASVAGCDGTLTGSLFTTAPVIADCTVSASFALNAYTVTPTAGLHGSIVPGTPQQAAANSSVAFTVTPDPAYRIASVSGCGGTLAGSTYATAPVTADCTVAASFAVSTVTVTPTAGLHGTIEPGTPQQAAANTSLVFTVTPDAAYRIASVSGCGGALTGSSYTTGSLTADCTVAASFAASTLTVTPSPGANGSIAPAGAQQVGLNDTFSFTVTPAAGYAIGSVSGCGGTLAGGVYTTAPVTADCTVTAVFVQSIAI